VTVLSALLANQTGVVHGFTGRTCPAGTTLDLGAQSTADAWDRAAAAVGAPECGTAIASQVHGHTALHATQPGLAGEADALISDTPGLIVAVRVADCVPILVAGDGVVAAIHAGWRGLASGVIGTALHAMQGQGPFVAAVGPRICVDCYEVGAEVVAGIGARVPIGHFVRDGAARPHVDLGAAAAHQLRAAGVEAVDVLAVCTRCDARFWSHRQSGAAAGRQAGLVGLRC
jgi:YfiH family protein